MAPKHREPEQVADERNGTASEETRAAGSAVRNFVFTITILGGLAVLFEYRLQTVTGTQARFEAGLIKLDERFDSVNDKHREERDAALRALEARLEKKLEELRQTHTTDDGYMQQLVYDFRKEMQQAAIMQATMSTNFENFNARVNAMELRSFGNRGVPADK